MAKFNFSVNDFGSGEWSPKLIGRSSTENYQRACRNMTNFIPQMTGGAAYRGGTFRIPFSTDTQDHINNVNTAVGGLHKLLPYVPQDRLKTCLLMATNILGTSYWHIVPVGTTPTVGTNAAGNYHPGSLQFEQINDLLFIVDGEGLQRPLVFYESGGYKLDAITGDYISTKPWKTIPWGPMNALDSGGTINPSATTGSVTLTSIGFDFASGMIGTYIRLCNGTNAAGVVQITGVTNATTATATVLQTLPNATFVYGSTTNNTSFWQISAWNDHYGWPRTVVAYQGRVIFGGNKENPDTIWGSRIGNIFDFEEVPEPNTTGVNGFANGSYLNNNARPFTLTTNSPDASRIVAMSAAKSLMINTDKGEILAYGSNGAFGPNNPQLESSSSFGATAVQPERINNFLTFVQRGGRKIRDVVYTETEDQYKSSDLAFVADHLTRFNSLSDGYDTIEELVKTEHNNSILWSRTYTGKILGVTLDRDYQVNAWFPLELGGDPDNPPKVLAIARAPGWRWMIGSSPISTGYFDTDYNYDTLWALVRRLIGGDPVVSLEVLNPPWEATNPFGGDWEFPNDPSSLTLYPVYLDCSSMQFEATATDTFTIEDYYDDLDISVVADGNYIGEFTPTGGTLTIDREAHHISYGFKYVGKLYPMPLEPGSQIGSSGGRIRRVDEAVVKFFNSLGTSYGYTGSVKEDIPMLSVDQNPSLGVTYFTGDKVINFPSDYGRSVGVEIEQHYPYPCHILSVVSRGVVYD